MPWVGEGGGDAGGMTLIDFSSGTTVNGGLFDGATTWGTGNRIVLSATHGQLNAGLDGGQRYASALAKPSGAYGFHMHVDVNNPPSTNSSGGGSELYFGAAPAAALTSNDGYYSLFQIWTTNALRFGAGTQRFGSNQSTNTAARTGTLHADFYLWFNSSGAAVGANSILRSGGGDVLAQSMQTGALTTSITNLYPFLGGGNTAGSPSATVDWGSNIQASYAWLTS